MFAEDFPNTAAAGAVGTLAVLLPGATPPLGPHIARVA